MTSILGKPTAVDLFNTNPLGVALGGVLVNTLFPIEEAYDVQ